MNSTSYTIRIFVPDGDPEGIRIIDRMNWTGNFPITDGRVWELTPPQRFWYFPITPKRSFEIPIPNRMQAAGQSNDLAEKFKNFLEKSMTLDQLAQAQRLAWKRGLDRQRQEPR